MTASVAPRPPAAKAATAVGHFFDDRFGSSGFVKRSINKVFPDHWSFLIGEIAMYSFFILLITGTYLALFFDASMKEVIYDGSYVPLKGVPMSQAFASTLHISFDVRAGLLFRQIHHWAALLFFASILVHMFRVFFTGAFRKPREMNWLIGIVLITLAFTEGFAGYSLPDDLLSGTGLRIAHSIMLSVPIVGTWVAYLAFGGDFPGNAILGRLYIVHVFLIPGLIMGLIMAHLGMVWFQKHTQFKGPGREEDNVVGERFVPHYQAKAGGFFMLVFGMLALLGGLFQINPVWLYGPYDKYQVSAGSQPDWYVGWLEGALRLMPNWEIRGAGHTWPFEVFLPGVALIGIVSTVAALYPFIEPLWTKDRGYHNLLDRPRDNPLRTSLGVAAIVWYLVLFASGGNDIIALKLGVSINSVTYAGRILFFVAPAIAFFVTRRICLSLQARDRDRVHHGVETGFIVRSPEGAFAEVHAPAPVKVVELVPVDDGLGSHDHEAREPVAD